METINTNTQSQGNEQKLVFLNIKRFFWSNKGKLILILDGNTAVAVHPNFLKARMGIDYTPVVRKEQAEAGTEPRVA